MLVTQEQRDQFNRLCARREAVASWLDKNEALASQIDPLLLKVDICNSTFLTVDPRDLTGRALGPLEEAETIASQHGFKLPPEYHKTPATIAEPQQSVVADVADAVGTAIGKAYDDAADLAMKGCKEIWPAFVCEKRAPNVSEIPWWVWAGGTIAVGGFGLYVYTLYKLAPVAARIGATVYAPELLPAVNQMFPGQTPPTPAVKEALQTKQTQDMFDQATTQLRPQR